MSESLAGRDRATREQPLVVALGGRCGFVKNRDVDGADSAIFVWIMDSPKFLEMMFSASGESAVHNFLMLSDEK